RSGIRARIRPGLPTRACSRGCDAAARGLPFVLSVSAARVRQSRTGTAMPMLGLTVSTTKRNDVALIGIVLLACGIGVLATGGDLTERVAAAGSLWIAALAAFAAARRF